MELANSLQPTQACQAVELNGLISGKQKMIKDTLIIVGPGGIGKSPLDLIIRDEALRIDPYRLRKTGPRDNDDIFYTHPKLRDELYLTYQRLGLSFSCLSSDVHWFPQAMTVFLKVRKNWQVLFLEGLSADIAKAEIYAPAIPFMMSNAHIRQVFGRIEIVVLNPGGTIKKKDNWGDIKDKTAENCESRGDPKDSRDSRFKSIDEEAPAWQQLIDEGATEYTSWQFPEHVYSNGDKTTILVKARKCLIESNPRLEVFFNTEDKIRELEKNTPVTH